MQTPHPPRALAMSIAVAPLLRETGRVGAVHSVFRHAANLLLPPQTLIAIADATATRAPNGIVIGALAAPQGDTFLGLSVEMEVWVGDGRVYVPATGLRLETADTPIWDPRPQFPSRPIAPAVLGQRLDDLARRVRQSASAKPLSFASLLDALARCDEGADAFGHTGNRQRTVLARKARPAAAALLLGIEMGEIDRISTAARRLTGLGHGLTPSGDDFLAGVCGALVLAEACLPASERGSQATLRDQAMAIATAAEGQTTLLSATWLHHAARGEFSAELGHVLADLADPGAAGLDRAITRLLALGDLSGLDTAMGVLLGGRAVVAAIRHHGQD